MPRPLGREKVEDHRKRSYIRAGFNLDGVIDEKDVGLVDKGFKVAIMSNQYTFSCGNALPAIAKYSSPKTKTLGETSGGGACVLRSTMSDIGSSYVLSGLTEISVEENGTIVNVGKGVEPDVAIARSSRRGIVQNPLLQGKKSHFMG